MNPLFKKSFPLIVVVSLFTLLATSVIQDTSTTGRIDQSTANTINPILGNLSFMETYNILPGPETDEKQFIQTHLSYVERLLRKKDASHLSASLQNNRTRILDLFKDYHEAGVFPRNYDFKDQRKPCFIDKDGRVCAVGYLVEQTAGRALAEDINASNKYATIYEMKSDALENWVASSGLTMEEFAMIQPTYGPPRGDNYIKPVYGVSTAIFSGASISLSAISASQRHDNSSHSKTVPALGLASGVSQIALGFGMFPKKVYSGGIGGGGAAGFEVNESHKALSLVNIGVGTSAMIMNTYYLFKKREKPNASLMEWSIYSSPAFQYLNQPDMEGEFAGLTMKKWF